MPYSGKSLPNKSIKSVCSLKVILQTEFPVIADTYSTKLLLPQPGSPSYRIALSNYMALNNFYKLTLVVGLF